MSSFQRLLGEALWAVKPEYVMMVIATKMPCMIKLGTSCARPRCEAYVKLPYDLHDGRTIKIALGHEL